MIQEKRSLSNKENERLKKHFESCKYELEGAARIEQMMKLIEYLETREWTK
jgi:hypothetical protein